MTPPTPLLTLQLNQIARDLATSVPAPDPYARASLARRAKDGQRKLEDMLSAAFPDKKGKRKSSGMAGTAAAPAQRDGRPRKEIKVEDFAAVVDDIVVANAARNLVRWGGV